MILLPKPFSLCIHVCIFWVKTAMVVMYISMQLVRALICFPMNMLWKTMIWLAALLYLPVRLLTALQRERLVEQHLLEMQFEVETLLWEGQKFQENIQTVIKEHRTLGSMLAEVEEERERAIAKIEKLEDEVNNLSSSTGFLSVELKPKHTIIDKPKVRALKEENIWLKEIRGQESWSLKGHADQDSGQNIGTIDDHHLPCWSDTWLSWHGKSSQICQDGMMKRDESTEENKNHTGLFSYLKAGSTSRAPVQPFTLNTDPRKMEISEILHKREIALSQTTLGAVLSLLVEMIIWESEDLCVPLLGALYAVVGMSLKSSFEFFSSVKNRAGSDAVALLSLNWFILGTLSYPTFSKVAWMFAPLISRVMDWMVSLLGF
ncbi:uncharacterized protein LOC110808644 isoform X1 [Carica papaya]|uniref:uncharacterized protein LOC110808644 isoform X1 n=1 Tax=Carica papaya TaxID=3649 RepID=UPI000B8D0A47|nr:uncharacterized protein LOC110808644 isoform X1 [Carica papaya]